MPRHSKISAGEGLAALRQGLWDQAATVLTAANKLLSNRFPRAEMWAHSWLIEERARLQSVRLWILLEHLATAFVLKLERFTTRPKSRPKL